MRSSLILLLLYLSFHLPAEILCLSPEEDSYCYVSPEADYLWAEGKLMPRQGLFSYFSGQGSHLLPEVIYSEEFDRGNILCGFIIIDCVIEHFSVELEDQDGNPIAEAGGFKIGNRQGFEVWCFLLGIPSDLTGGIYRLTIMGGQGNRHFRYLGAVKVGAKQYAFERILLDKGLEDLVSKPDVRKVKEARNLRELLLSFRSDAFYHTGSFILPVSGARISSNFAARRKYQFMGGGFSSVHNGIDLAAPQGTPVMACGSGKVVFAGYRIMSGNTVVLEHLPGVYTLYFHLLDLKVRDGDMVKSGGILGSIGMTGLATGPHLHWELRVSGVAVDPGAVLQSGLIDKTAVSGIIKEIILEGRR